MVDRFELVDEVRDPCLVDAIRHLGMGGKRLGIGGAGEQVARREMEGQLPHPDLVARAQQPVLARVPQRKGEIAEQARQAVVAPAQVSADDQLPVAHHPLGRGKAEVGDQFGPVVEPDMGGDDAAAFGLAVGHGLGQSLGRGRIERMAEGGRAIGAQGRSVGPSRCHGGKHGGKAGGVGRCAIEAQYGADAAHVRRPVPPRSTPRGRAG